MPRAVGQEEEGRQPTSVLKIQVHFESQNYRNTCTPQPTPSSGLQSTVTYDLKVFGFWRGEGWEVG